MWLMLQQPTPDDYVLATNENHSVREFIEHAFQHAGTTIQWKGTGVNETGINTKTGKTVVKINPKFFRPGEVDQLLGDYSKARNKLGWEPKVKFKDLVTIMVERDLERVKKEQ
jgi:GDPmannose 4,6-dehydratase